MRKTDSTLGQAEIKPVVQRIDDRIDRKLSAVIDADSAIAQLNECFRALLGINAINAILLANAVAEDCDEPIIGRHLVGGLLDAAVCLSNFASNEIEFFADRADTEYEKLNTREANRG